MDRQEGSLAGDKIWAYWKEAEDVDCFVTGCFFQRTITSGFNPIQV